MITPYLLIVQDRSHNNTNKGQSHLALGGITANMLFGGVMPVWDLQ